MLNAVVSKVSSDLESTISARASVIGVNAALSVAYKNLLDIVYKFHCLHQFERKNQWQLDPLVSPKPLWHPQGQFWYVQCASQVGTRVLQECALIPWCHPCPSESGAEEFGIVCLPLEVLHSEFHLCWLKKHQVAKKIVLCRDGSHQGQLFMMMPWPWLDLFLLSPGKLYHLLLLEC